MSANKIALISIPFSLLTTTFAFFSINSSNELAQAVVAEMVLLAMMLPDVDGLKTLMSALSQRAVWCLPPHLLQLRVEVQSLSSCFAPKNLRIFFNRASWNSSLI